MIATLLAAVDPGEEVIVFEPWYENYGPDAILSGATPVYVKLHAPDWQYDPAELRAAFSERTKAIIVNTPHTPTGKVFTRAERSVPNTTKSLPPNTGAGAIYSCQALRA